MGAWLICIVEGVLCLLLKVIIGGLTLVPDVFADMVFELTVHGILLAESHF